MKKYIILKSCSLCDKTNVFIPEDRKEELCHSCYYFTKYNIGSKL